MTGVIFFIAILTSCSGKQLQAVTVSDLAYDANKIQDQTIYIKENQTYIPYLVLTKDYNGNTLVLRKEILDQKYPFSNEDDDYYAESYVDSYLNSDYYKCFSENMKKIIQNSEIEIAAEYPNDETIETIERKIFLLSCTEVNIDMGITIREGVKLKYFEKSKNLLCKTGESYVGWKLRSNYLPERGMSWNISAEGVAGGESVQRLNGIRPAFCISSSTKVTKKQVSSSKEGYVLTMEEK